MHRLFPQNNMEKKEAPERTFQLARKEREVSQAATENLKLFNRAKRSIGQALENGPLTIPELAEKLGMDKAEATYYIMTMRKYGLVTAGEQDAMDEYFYYQLNKP